jgi:DNA-binding MarR family transcriptional regulator
MSAVRKPHPSSYRELADFRHEIRRFLNFSERAARAAGIEPHQHQALLAIKGLPAGTNATVGVLAERLQVQHHTAGELTDRLQRKKLLRRLRSQIDQREVFLKLTPRGEQLLRKLSRAHQAELQSAAPKLIVALREIIRSNSHRKSSSAGTPMRKIR